MQDIYKAWIDVNNGRWSGYSSHYVGYFLNKDNIYAACADWMNMEVDFLYDIRINGMPDLNALEYNMDDLAGDIKDQKSNTFTLNGIDYYIKVMPITISDLEQSENK